MKRIVLFVEGEGESDAVPKLVKKLLTEQNAWDVVFLDDAPFRVGEVTKLDVRMQGAAVALGGVGLGKKFVYLMGDALHSLPARSNFTQKTGVACANLFRCAIRIENLFQ
jgi:hypothetical protein